MAKPSLAPIYERLSGVTRYHPLSADTFMDWSVEAGDIVTVGRDGTQYTSPLHSVKLKWNGAPKTQIESVGERKRDPIAKMSVQKYNGGGPGGGGGGAGVRNSDYYRTRFDRDEYHISLASEHADKANAILQAAGIDINSQTGVVVYHDDIENGVGARINVQSNKIETIVGTYVEQGQERYYIKAGEIALAINEAGESEAHIDANKVYIGNEKSTTVIAGKLNASDVTTDYLSAKIGQIPVLTVRSLAVQSGGSINSAGYVYAPNFVIGSNSSQGGSNIYLTSAVVGVDVTGNVLKLTQANGNETTFSKATSVSGVWGGVGGTAYTATAKQNGTTVGTASTVITSLGASATGINPNNNKQMLVDVEVVFDNDHTVTITDSPVGAVPVWNAAEAQFELVDITLQGTAYGTITPIASGTGVVPTKKTRSVASSNGTYYLRNTTEHTVSATRGTNQGSAWKKLKYYGDTTLYVAPTGGATGIRHQWYYVDSDGTQYYNAGSSYTHLTVTGLTAGTTLYTSAGTATKYSISEETFYDVGSAYELAWLYKAGTDITGLRNPGTRYNKTTYYTKNS